MLKSNVLGKSVLFFGILAVLGYSAGAAAPPEERPVATWEASEDLDGDGALDSIRVEVTDPLGLCTVTVRVNSASLSIHTLGIAQKFWITDIDTMSATKEIAVWDPGHSDDYSNHFLSFDGVRVRQMGMVPGRNVFLDGSGIVQGRKRGHILHTWYFPALYRLTVDNELRFIQQPLYPMSTPVRLLVDLPIHRERNLESHAWLAKAGSCGVITFSDNEKWCRLEILKGHSGWFRVERHHWVRGRPAHEIFEGLCHAD